MTKTVTRRKVILTAAGAAAAAPFAAMLTGGAAVADGHTSHDVQMMNRDPDGKIRGQLFSPRILQVNAGDTVNFLSTDRGHNSASADGMIPEGAEGWDSKVNEDLSVTFDTPGIYGYVCTPHASAGMVGLIVVEGEGKLANLEAAKGVRQRGKARKVWEEVWKEAEEMGLLEETTA
jgi:pseudoazurin